MIKANTIQELNNQLNRYKYGCIYGEFPKDYRSIEPTLFDRRKIGICWDFVAFEAYYMDKHFPKIDYRTYYIEMDHGKRCHSFMVFRTGLGQYGLFESCRRPKGIDFFWESKQALLQVAVSMNRDKKNPYVIIEYELPDKYDLTAEEYITHVFQTGEIVLETHNYMRHRNDPIG